MKSENLEINTLEGERGIPNVNDAPKGKAQRKFKLGFLIFGLLMTALLAYYSHAAKKEKLKKHERREVELTKNVPDRSFKNDLGLMDNPNNKGLFKPEKPEDINLQTAQAVLRIDKSSSSLMVESENHQSSNRQSTTDKQAFDEGNLSPHLRATKTQTHMASLLKDRDFLLTKGKYIPCLPNKFDSTLSGMTQCVVTQNIYSDTGKVLLIERGSTISGEYQANLQQGQNRIHALWNRIKTPHGVVADVDSLGVDPLGGSGIPGHVNTHFWQRFGAALLISSLQDISKAATSHLEQREGNHIKFVSAPDASQNMAAEALKNSINIPPTLFKNQGDEIGIYVARDLNFKSVYGLEPQ